MSFVVRRSSFVVEVSQPGVDMGQGIPALSGTQWPHTRQLEGGPFACFFAPHDDLFDTAVWF